MPKLLIITSKNYLIISESPETGKALGEILSSQNHQSFVTCNKSNQEGTSNIHYQNLNVMDEQIELSSLP